jgi:hypothetical protein
MLNPYYYLFPRYYRPGEKIYGNTRGKLLHCQWKGHNACLPDCVRNGLGVGKARAARDLVFALDF